MTFSHKWALRRSLFQPEEFELDEGEYIAHVEGRSGWYLDQITFVTNKGRKFGPIGGDGGDQFSTFKQHTENAFNNISWHVGGIQACKVRSQESDIIARVKFLMCIINNNEESEDYVDRLMVDMDLYDDPMYYDALGYYQGDIPHTDTEEEDDTDDEDDEDEGDDALVVDD